MRLARPVAMPKAVRNLQVEDRALASGARTVNVMRYASKKEKNHFAAFFMFYCFFAENNLIYKEIFIGGNDMDATEEILNLLRDNARLSTQDISAMTKKTPDQVEAIIKKLENDGVIMKYAAIVNPEKDPSKSAKVRAEIEIQVQPQREHGFDGIADRIYRFPQVKSLYLMSGGYDLKVVIEGESLQEVAFFVARKLSTLEGVRSTKTHFFLKTYKENDIVYVEENSDSREGVTA